MILISVERIWAFFKTRVIQRKKGSGFITGSTLVRSGTNTILARRVTKLTSSRIVKISFGTNWEALS